MEITLQYRDPTKKADAAAYLCGALNTQGCIVDEHTFAVCADVLIIHTTPQAADSMLLLRDRINESEAAWTLAISNLQTDRKFLQHFLPV